jgi:ubiquinone/menaquinone biosynthesis C-methylase UbiE
MSHLKNLEKHISDLKDKKILDLGSGRGDFLIYLTQNKYNIIGLEKNPDYISIIREKAGKENLNVNLFQGEAENLPFENNVFEFINCNEITEHVNKPEKLLFECCRVLKEGGQMYVSFHNRFGIYDYHYHLWFINWLPRVFADKFIKLIGKEKKYTKAGFQKLSEMHYYTYPQIIKLLKKYNFKIKDTRKEKIKNKLIYNFIKYLIPTYHFIIEKQ